MCQLPRSLSLALLSSLLATLCANADWPGFRGPAGDGVAAGDAPIKWSKDQGVRWRVPLSGPGNGSPIVAGGKVYVACSEDKKGTRRSLYCFDAKTGEQAWVKTVEFDKAMPTHKTNPPCSTTPAAGDGKVVVWHASAGLYCYDFDGTEKWHRDLGEFRHMWGYGSSPIVRDGVVYLQCGPGEKTFVTAIDLESGDTTWSTEEKMEGGSAERTPEKHYRGSWSTPLLTSVGGKPQLICALPTRVCGYDVTDGKPMWFCEGLKGPKGELAYSSPMIAGDTCVVIGGFKGPSIGFELDGLGEKESKWRRQEKNPQNIGTGIYHDGFLYVPDAGPPGVRCIDPATGEVKWQHEVNRKNFWGSITLAGGHAYVIDQSGDTHVFKPSPDGFKPLAVNSLDEPCNTTPAVSGGEIFIRTDAALYCIGAE